MCGRDYSTYSEAELYDRYLNKKTYQWPLFDKIPEFKPNYNMCPTQTTLVLSVFDGKIGFREMRWGLVPGWAKTVKDADKYSMINAKSEEITEKRSYKSAFKKQRCIVPVSGFYEWKREGKSKTPFAIHLKDEKIMSLAGIWEKWQDRETKEIVHSYSIITMSANPFMSKIHDRMPVILKEESENDWLDPEISDEAKALKIVNASDGEGLACFQVSTSVNSPKNNSKEVLMPV